MAGAGWRGVGRVSVANRKQKENKMTVAEAKRSRSCSVLAPKGEHEMTYSDNDRSQVRWARLAGFMYLFVDLAYLVGVMIANHIEVPGNITETARAIMRSELLYRIGLTSIFIGALCTVFLAMGLYVTVKPVDKNLALLALLFRLAEATIFGLQSLFSFVVLKVFISSDYTKSFGSSQPAVIVNLRSAVYSDGFIVAGLFFCIGSILFFYLLFKSNYLPKALSAFGLFGTLLVTITNFADLLLPQYHRILQLGEMPLGVAEILVGLWLLIKGLDLHPRELNQGTRYESDCP